MLLAGKKALVIGYGDVGKGSIDSLNQQKYSDDGGRSNLVMQACFDDIVVSAYKNGDVGETGINLDKKLLEKYDLVVTTTGNVNVLDSIC